MSNDKAQSSNKVQMTKPKVQIKNIWYSAFVNTTAKEAEVGFGF